MINFSMKLAEGLGTAGWVIGFLAGLGLFMILVGLLILLFMAAGDIVFGKEDKEEDHDDVDD